MIDKINKPSGGDVVHSLTKGVLGAIPVIGSLATEIFETIITPPLEKRRVEWMNDISERLKSLEGKHNINIQELKDNEQFIDIVLQATILALKTSEKEKIEAFQNAVLNTASGDSPEQTISQIFLNLLDSFTVWHIKILKFIDNPILWFNKNSKTPPNFTMGSISLVLMEAFPELKNREELLDLIWNDLRLAGFHNTSGIRTTMSGGGVFSERTTPLAKQFLKFININES